MTRPIIVSRRHRTGARILLAACISVALPAEAVAVNDPYLEQQWNLQAIGAQEAWRTGTGAGITIAVIDSGVDLAHEDLTANLTGGWNIVDGNANARDVCGHGTHVAGIAAATTNNGRGVAGVAPGARIMPVRVLSSSVLGQCGGTTSDVIAGIRWAVENGAQVLNLSIGDLVQGLFGADSGFTDTLAWAWNRGAIPVVAASNDYLFSSGYGDDPAVVVVATDPDDQRAGYSSSPGGARWAMAAPGGRGGSRPQDDILSTYWVEGRQNEYGWLAGTSMAAPHVAGAAAVLLSLGLTPRQTVDRLLETAAPVGSQSQVGAGRLDLAASVAGLGASTPTAPAPGPPGTPGPPAASSPAQRPAAPPAETVWPQAQTPADDPEEGAPPAEGAPPEGVEGAGSEDEAASPPGPSYPLGGAEPAVLTSVAVALLGLVALGLWRAFRRRPGEPAT